MRMLSRLQTAYPAVFREALPQLSASGSLRLELLAQDDAAATTHAANAPTATLRFAKLADGPVFSLDVQPLLDWYRASGRRLAREAEAARHVLAAAPPPPPSRPQDAEAPLSSAPPPPDPAGPAREAELVDLLGRVFGDEGWAPMRILVRGTSSLHSGGRATPHRTAQHSTAQRRPCHAAPHQHRTCTPRHPTARAPRLAPLPSHRAPSGHLPGTFRAPSGHLPGTFRAPSRRAPSRRALRVSPASHGVVLTRH
jgi:hypothetical protein